MACFSHGIPLCIVSNVFFWYLYIFVRTSIFGFGIYCRRLNAKSNKLMYHMQIFRFLTFNIFWIIYLSTSRVFLVERFVIFRQIPNASPGKNASTYIFSYTSRIEMSQSKIAYRHENRTFCYKLLFYLLVFIIMRVFIFIKLFIFYFYINLNKLCRNLYQSSFLSHSI